MVSLTKVASAVAWLSKSGAKRRLLNPILERRQPQGNRVNAHSFLPQAGERFLFHPIALRVHHMWDDFIWRGPWRADAVKRLRRSYTSFRPLRGDCAVATWRLSTMIF